MKLSRCVNVSACDVASLPEDDVAFPLFADMRPEDATTRFYDYDPRLISRGGGLDGTNLEVRRGEHGQS